MAGLSLKAAALAQFLATVEARKTLHISLVGQVANAYLAVLGDDELLAITQQTLSTRQESFKLAKLRFDNGVTSELDLRLAESLLEAANVSLAQQTRQRALDENTLTLLVGQALVGELAISASAGTSPAASSVTSADTAAKKSLVQTVLPDVTVS